MADKLFTDREWPSGHRPRRKGSATGVMRVLDAQKPLTYAEIMDGWRMCPFHGKVYAGNGGAKVYAGNGGACPVCFPPPLAA